MNPSISVLCPTIGRTSLKALLDDLVYFGESDELLVIGDGPQPVSRQILGGCQDRRVCYAEYGPTGDFGGSQLDFAIRHLAKGDYLMFVGDDDRLGENALEIVRERVKHDEQPRPHLFGMLHQGRHLHGELTSGQVSGQQIVLPRHSDRIPQWKWFPQQDGDARFIHLAAHMWGDLPMHDEVICLLTQQHYGKVF